MCKSYELFLANLDPEITEDDLREAFAKIGDLHSVTLIPAKHIAFISYFRKEDAELALKTFWGFEFFGRSIFVDWARPKRKVRKKAS